MNRKTKEQLLNELESLKERLKELETEGLEQKKVIETLSESEAKYRLLFDAAPVGIGIADLKGNIIDANRNMQEMSGFSLEEYRRIGVEATYADPKERKLFIKSLREKGKVRDWEGRLKRKDGSQYHALLNADVMELGGREVLLGIIRDISDRKRIDAALHTALADAEGEKNKSDAIVAALGDGIIIQDTDYKIIYQNQVQNDLYGDRTGELCYRTYEGRDKICEDCPVERTFRDGKIHRSEKKVTTDNGDLYFELTSSPLRDSNGKIIAGIKVVREITRQKRLEQTLRESEEKYRRLVETLMEGIWVLDKDANTTFVNPRMAQMLGYTVDEMLGKHLFSYMDEKGREDAKRYLERRAQNIKEQHDFEFIRKDGTRIYTSLETSPITDENGNYSGAVAAIADITERKYAEEKLRDGEQFLENIFASIQDGIGVIDRDMNIISVNKTAQSWYPHSMPFIGKKCYEAYHNRKERCEKCPAWETLKTGRSAYKEVPKHGPEGKEVGWLEIYSYPLNDTTTGKMKGVIEYVRDITERKQAEEESRLNSEIFKNVSEGICLIGIEDGIIKHTNSKFEKMFGYEPGEMIGKDIVIVNTPTDKTPEETKVEIMAALRNTGEWHGEINNIRKDGTPFWSYANVSLFDHPQYGRVIISVHTDITERKSTEEELKQSEEKYRLLIENIQEGVFVIQDAKIVFVNQAFAEIAGYSIEEIIGTDFYHFVAPEDLEIVKDRYYRRQKGENVPEEYEFHALRKNGEKPIVNMNVGIVPYRGRISSMGILRDITAKKRAEESLKLFSEAVESAPDGIQIVDIGGYIKYSNKAAVGHN